MRPSGNRESGCRATGFAPRWWQREQRLENWSSRWSPLWCHRTWPLPSATSIPAKSDLGRSESLLKCLIIKGGSNRFRSEIRTVAPGKAMLNLRRTECWGMAESSETLGSIRFGRFDLSVETGELRKDGVRLKLSGQAVEVLLLLIASPGKLVAREELQQRLWPGASYGDPEHGLNAAVNRLRETLGDSATEPKYIETVPGRGYRFIAKLNLPVVPPEPEPPEPEPTSEPPKPRWWKRKAAIAVAACVGVAGLLYPGIAPQIERLWRLNELQHLTSVPLTALPGNVASPTFSPDGSQVAFGWDGETNGAGFDLYVKAVGSDKPLRLTYHPSAWLFAAWSPDGRSIAVSRSGGGDDSGIYLVPPTGGPERKLVARSAI